MLHIPSSHRPSSDSPSRPPKSTQKHCQQNNSQNNAQNQQQATSLAPRILLISRRCSQLPIGPACVIPHIFDIVGDGIQHLPLLVNDLRHLLKQNVEIADTLFDGSDILLPLNNECVLEVYIILRRKPGEFLLLLKELWGGG